MKLAEAFEKEIPLKIRISPDHERTIAHGFITPDGILFFDVFWCNLNGSHPVHWIKGVIGKGKQSDLDGGMVWKVGDAKVIEIHDDVPERGKDMYLEYMDWEEYKKTSNGKLETRERAKEKVDLYLRQFYENEKEQSEISGTNLATSSLKDFFRSWNKNKIASFIEEISSKSLSGEIFPPYIPFIGSNYKKCRILFYSTANNINPSKTEHQKVIDCWSLLLESNDIDRLIGRLYYNKDFSIRYPDKGFLTPEFIGSYGIVWGLLGIFLYARFNQEIDDRRKIMDSVSMSNFYKFSLRKNNKDLNPKSFNKKQREYYSDYIKSNFELVEKEIRLLDPSIIVSFKGEHELKFLESKFGDKIEIIGINDPAWLWRGGRKHCGKNGNWSKIASKISDIKARKLAKLYTTWHTGNKVSEQEMETYLLYYYDSFTV